MCTPWTVPRLVRWRIRDWASCFLACRFPLDDEQDSYYCSPSPQLSIRNVVFDIEEDKRGQKTDKKLARRSRRSGHRRVELSPRQLMSNGSAETGSDSNSSWPHFSEEDYIVFCFREDGAFDVVKDGKAEASNLYRRSLRPVNGKANYGEDAEAVDNGSHEGMSNEDGNSITLRMEREIINLKEGEEEEERRYQVEESEKSRMMSAESRDSNQSDGSTGSFAFPVLGWEWMGSPVQMPKSEGLHLRKQKQKPCSLSFQCCRF